MAEPVLLTHQCFHCYWAVSCTASRLSLQPSSPQEDGQEAGRGHSSHSWPELTKHPIHTKTHPVQQQHLLLRKRMGGFPKQLLHFLKPCLPEGDWESALWERVNKFPFLVCLQSQLCFLNWEHPNYELSIDIFPPCPLVRHKWENSWMGMGKPGKVKIPWCLMYSI